MISIVMSMSFIGVYLSVAQVGFNNSEYIIPEGSGRAEICIQTSIEVDIQFSVFVAGKPLSASCELTID